jgi:hypothetical protein
MVDGGQPTARNPASSTVKKAGYLYPEYCSSQLPYVQSQEQQPKAGESSVGQAIQKGEAVEGSPSVSRTAAMSSLPQYGQGCPGPFTAPTVAPLPIGAAT